MRAAGAMDVGAFEADRTSPAVTAAPKSSTEGRLATDSDFIFDFSELVRPGIGEITLSDSTGKTLETFDIKTSPLLTLSGSQLRIDPTQDLKSNASYVIAIPKGALLDAAGNTVAAQSLEIKSTPFARYLIGGATADALSGTADNDLLNGGAGADQINGQDGSDVYVVASPDHHTAAEFHDTGMMGTDTIRFAAEGGTLVVFAEDTGIEQIVLGTGDELTANTSGAAALGVNLYQSPNAMTVVGNAGSNAITGSRFADTLNGGQGNDVLAGGKGADVLSGGEGLDQLRGGKGYDRFVFDTNLGTSNVDRILDFKHKADRIMLSDDIFAGLGTATTLHRIKPGEFVQGRGLKHAQDKSDNIIYNKATGALFYDPDGVGGEAAIKIATLGTKANHPLSLSHHDFWVF